MRRAIAAALCAAIGLGCGSSGEQAFKDEAEERAAAEREQALRGLEEMEAALTAELRDQMARARRHEDAGSPELAIGEYQAIVNVHPHRGEAEDARKAIARLKGGR